MINNPESTAEQIVEASRNSSFATKVKITKLNIEKSNIALERTKIEENDQKRSQNKKIYQLKATGTLKYTSRNHTYGFIRVDNLDMDLFVHVSDIFTSKYVKTPLLKEMENTRLQFDIVYYEKKGKEQPKAINVALENGTLVENHEIYHKSNERYVKKPFIIQNMITDVTDLTSENEEMDQNNTEIRNDTGKFMQIIKNENEIFRKSNKTDIDANSENSNSSNNSISKIPWDIIKDDKETKYITRSAKKVTINKNFDNFLHSINTTNLKKNGGNIQTNKK